MFSTQDSRPSKQNKSLNTELIPSTEIVLSNHLEYDSKVQLQTSYSTKIYQDEDQYDNYEEEESDFFNSQDQKSEVINPNDSKIKVTLQNEQKKMKRASTRKSHPVANLNEYQIEIDYINQPTRTTLMIKNIPNRYTKDMMMEMIDHSFSKTYDFFYLPIDFDHDANVGYAFINFIDIKFIRDFYLTFNGRKWPVFNSDKVCKISYARIQGLGACTEHFENSSLMKQNVPLLEFAL